MPMSLIILQQRRDLSFYSLVKTAREAISSTYLDVLLNHNLYSANLKPLFLFQIYNFTQQLSIKYCHPSLSVNLFSFHKTITSVP